MLGAVDERIGDFIEFLQSEGAWENTIFIFTSDNGSTLWQQEYNAGLRGQKASVYEGGHHVPCFLTWPAGNWETPRELDALTEIQDWFPTLAAACELELPEEFEYDGQSLLPLLERNEQAELNERCLVVQFHEEKYDAAVLYKNWRLVKGEELFDLTQDPAQTTNIAAAQPELVSRLRKHYEAWWSMRAQADEPAPYFLNAEEPIMLTAYDWYAGPRVYNWPHLRAGDQSQGKYLLEVTQPGRYRVALRRWPRESGAGLRDSVPSFTPQDDFLDPLATGIALDIVGVKVELGGDIQQLAVHEGLEEAVFEFELPAGLTHLQCWFELADGAEMGAYYVYIEDSN